MNRKFGALILSIFAIAILMVAGCKKEEEDKPNTLADKVAGNYAVLDTITVFNPPCLGATDQATTFNITVTKKTDNTVTIKNFRGCAQDKEATVTETSITITSSIGTCNDDSITGTISGNKITFTYKHYDGCTWDGKAVATKQQ